MRRISRVFLAIAFAAATGAAQSAPTLFEVEAAGDSLSGGSGSGLSTGLTLSIGDRLLSTSAVDDLWSAGAADRTSNANGLGPDNYTCATCGTSYGLYSYDGENFHYGSLVGRIGSGDYFKLGVSFDAIVADAGPLVLFYWDSNSYDNSGSVTAAIEVNPREGQVPVPAVPGLIGLGLLILWARQRLAMPA